MMDLDGEVLIPDNAFPIADISLGVFDSFFMIGPGLNAGGSHTCPEDLDIARLAWGTDQNTNTHAQTRLIAESLMAEFGITSLA